eukprot:gene11459-23966_t
MSFSSLLTTKYCDRPLTEGTVIMGQKVKLNITSSVEVLRGDVSLRDGDVYYPSEILLVRTVPKTNEVVLETSGGAVFINGGCQGRRSTIHGSNLSMPASAGNVSIWAGWAKTFSSGVKITPSITLCPQDGALRNNESPDEHEL